MPDRRGGRRAAARPPDLHRSTMPESIPTSRGPIVAGVLPAPRSPGPATAGRTRSSHGRPRRPRALARSSRPPSTARARPGRQPGLPADPLPGGRRGIVQALLVGQSGPHHFSAVFEVEDRAARHERRLVRRRRRRPLPGPGRVPGGHLPGRGRLGRPVRRDARRRPAGDGLGPRPATAWSSSPRPRPRSPSPRTGGGGPASRPSPGPPLRPLPAPVRPPPPTVGPITGNGCRTSAGRPGDRPTGPHHPRIEGPRWTT